MAGLCARHRCRCGLVEGQEGNRRRTIRGPSKAATAKPNPNAVSTDRKVIGVYSYDWTDYDDVMRIRAELKNLGVNWKISYKSDADTMADKYSIKGDRNIAKYYI